MGNKSGALILLIMLIVSAFVILMVKLAAYIRHFNGETRRIIMKMQRAADAKEYCYWHKMLRCHYLCLIPFVNERNVSGAYSFFFHQPKRAEKETRIDGVFHILAPSLAAFCLCAVCLCGASWAWFTASSGIGAAKVQAATYTVKIECEPETGVWQDGEYQISLYGNPDSKKTYNLCITATGTTTNGFCDVKIGDKTYQIDQIPKDSGFVFSVEVPANENAKLVITPKWGTYSHTATIQDNGKIAATGSQQSNTQEPNSIVTTEPTAPTTPTTPTTPSNSPAESETTTPELSATAPAPTEPESTTDTEPTPASEETTADPQEAGAWEENGSPRA